MADNHHQTTSPSQDSHPNLIFLQGWRPYFIIFILGFIVYFRTLSFGFTYLDDNQLLISNYPFIKNPANLVQAFRQDVFLSYQNAYYRPLLTVSFILEAQLMGNSPQPIIFHFTNLLIHLATSCLIYLFLIKFGLNKPLSFVFALLFTIHPVLTQAVAWIPGRNDSLLTVFILAAFLKLIKFQQNKRLRSLATHLLFFTLALFTKETALALPLLGLIYLYLVVREKLFSTTVIRLFLSWLGIGLVWFWLRQQAFSHPLSFSFSDIVNSEVTHFPAVIQFIGKIIFPVNLSVFPILQDTTYIYGLIAITLVILGLVFGHPRPKFVFFGLLWFLAFLLPSFIRPASTGPADFLEHRVYLPLVGFFLIIAEIGAVKRLNFNYLSSVICTGLLIATFSLLTFFHTQNFANRLTFWQNAVRTSPHSPLAHRNLGAMYYLDGRLDSAETEAKAALQLNPNEPMAHNNLGLIYASKNLFPQAEAEYQAELVTNPNYDDVNFNLGLLYYRQGKLIRAKDLWQKTLEINPNYLSAYQNLAAYYHQQGDLSKANYYAQELQKRGLNP